MSVMIGNPREAGPYYEEPDPDTRWHRWQDWANLLVGIWLWACSGVFDSLGSTPCAEAATTAIIAGTIIAGVSLWALAEPEIREIEGILAVTSAWLILTPAMFDFTSIDPISAMNHWATGAIGLVLSLWALMNHAAAKAARG